MKDDVQSAIAAMEKDGNTGIAIDDLSHPETFDVVMAKVTDEGKNNPALGVVELQWVESYLLIPQDVGTTIRQMELLDIIDHDGVTSNILIKTQEAALLHIMNWAICVVEDHVKTHGETPMQEETSNQLRTALSNMVHDSPYYIPVIHPQQEDGIESLSPRAIPIEGAPAHEQEYGQRMSEQEGTDAQGDSTMGNKEEKNSLTSYVAQWESYICKVAVAGYRAILSNSTEVEGEVPPPNIQGAGKVD